MSIPTSDKTLQKDDIILVITAPSEADGLRLIFGEQELKDWNAENIDWNAVDSQLISQRILVTRPEINGRKLSSPVSYTHLCVVAVRFASSAWVLRPL